MLHTVNKSPTERNALDSCLKHLTKDSAVLLIEDGVYGALKGASTSQMVEQALKNCAIYALYPDIEARGLTKYRSTTDHFCALIDLNSNVVYERL